MKATMNVDIMWMKRRWVDLTVVMETDNFLIMLRIIEGFDF